MVLIAKTKIIRSPNSYTQYLTIPAAVVRDSQYPLRDGQEVELVVIPSKRMLEIRAIEEQIENKKEEIIR